MTFKQVTVQYRYLNMDNLAEGFHLKDVVVDVLRRASGGRAALFEDVSTRKKDLDQDGSYVVLNKLSEESTWDGPILCGQLIHVKAGINVPGIRGDLDQAIPELQLTNLTIGEQAKIVEGVLYFTIIHNHIGIIEGQRTRARSLERYLTRLLQDAGEMEPGETVILNTRLEGTIGKVKELTVAPISSTPSSDEPVVISSDAASVEGKDATVLDVLELLGWSVDDISNLQSSLPEDGWLEGLFKVAFKRKGRRSAPVDRSMLETALRNLDPASVGLLGPDGIREKNSLIKLSYKTKVIQVGELLDPEDAMKAIVQTLTKWSEKGRIDCDFEP